MEVTRRAGGYTLVEFALVTGLMAFMLSQAMPALIERAADQRVRATVEDARALAAAAVRYRTNPEQITAPEAGHPGRNGHYGWWPGQDAVDVNDRTAAPRDAYGDLVPYLGAFRTNAARDGFRNGVGRAIALHPPDPVPNPPAPPAPNLDGPLRIAVDFGDPAHAARFAFLAGPTACVDGQPGCPDCGVPAPPAGDSRACYFVPPPSEEFIHDHFALLDGSRPFVLDGGPLVIGDPAAVSIEQDGRMDVRGNVEIGGRLEAEDNVEVAGWVRADAIIAGQVDAATVTFCVPGCAIGTTGRTCPGATPTGVSC